MSRTNYLELQFKTRRKKLRRNGYRSYSEFLRSNEWKILREKANCSGQHQKCWVCGSKEKLDLHHLSYRFIGRPREQFQHLRRLCRLCHFAAHDLVRKYPYDMTLKTAVKRLRKLYLKKSVRWLSPKIAKPDVDTPYYDAFMIAST